MFCGDIFSVFFLPLLPSGCFARSSPGQIALVVAKVAANKCTDHQQLLIKQLLTGAIYCTASERLEGYR